MSTGVPPVIHRLSRIQTQSPERLPTTTTPLPEIFGGGGATDHESESSHFPNAPSGRQSRSNSSERRCKGRVGEWIRGCEWS